MDYLRFILAGIFLFKVNYGKSGAICEICVWRRFDVFIINF